MDIKKSQRLSQYLGIISDMVEYKDVGSVMVECGTLSVEEHGILKRKHETDGNIAAMNELLTMINLRRGGFDAFLKVLRNTDYVWIAEQLDPEKVFTEPSSCTKRGKSSAKMQNLISNVRQTIRRKSETALTESRTMDGDEFTHMSYRGSCPIGLPVSTLSENCIDDENEKGSCWDTVPSTISSETLQEPMMTTKVPQDDITDQLMNLELKHDAKSSNNTIYIENFPGPLMETSTVEYFTKLAKRLDVPADLMVICDKKISKIKRRKKNNVKLQFQTENVRNHFIQSFKELIINLEPTDELYKTAKQLNISVPKTKGSGRVFKKKLNKCGNGNEKTFSCPHSNSDASNPFRLETDADKKKESKKPSRKHWYQQRLKLKSWRKGKV